MSENLMEQRDHIIHNLEILNAKVARQMSFRFIFITGMISGLGFVVGTTVIGAIALGILSQLFGDVPVVRDLFSTRS